MAQQAEPAGLAGAEPPDACQHPLTWQLARALLDAHPVGADGRCLGCPPGTPIPCAGRRLAAAGLRAACGQGGGPSVRAWRDLVRARLAGGDPDRAAAEAVWPAPFTLAGR